MSGFFAWIVVLDDESIHCGSDPFGLFPIYYFQEKSTFGIATSLKAFHACPDYDRSVDPIGFSRHLIENGCASYRTMEKSGKRLDIAESISYQWISGTPDRTQHSYPGKNAVKDVQSLADGIELSIEASRQAVKRHTQRSIGSCMLSGGLDSRQVLSIAHEIGHEPKCVTFGEQNSDENVCARMVARNLQLEWDCSEVFSESPQIALDDELNLLSLGGGFNGVSHWWGKTESIQGSRCLKGLYLDVTYCPFAREHKDLTFGSYRFAQETWLHAFGTHASELADFYKDQTFRDGLDAALSECRSEWEMFPENPCERQWHSISRYRARSHHGGILWKSAFHHWPVIPALDVPLTDAIRRIDGDLFTDRKLQKEAFKAMRPNLAKIPFAAVKASPKPLIETKRNLYYKNLRKLRKKGLQLRGKYFNHSDASSDAKIQCWREAHLRSLKHLEKGSEIFDVEKVKESLGDFYESGIKVRWNRKIYSQRLLVGGIAWLAGRES